MKQAARHLRRLRLAVLALLLSAACISPAYAQELEPDATDVAEEPQADDAGPAETPASPAEAGDATDDVPDPLEDPKAALATLREAKASGGWIAMIGVIVLMIVKLARRNLAKLQSWFGWLESTIGGYAFVAGTAVLVAIAAEAWAFGEVGWSILLEAFLAGVMSIALSPGEDEKVRAKVAESQAKKGVLV